MDARPRRLLVSFASQHNRSTPVATSAPVNSIAASPLPTTSSAHPRAGQSMSGAEAMSMQKPVDFTNPTRTLGASPALLQGKILRGGMGTGMPMWGSILTEEQIWDLIAYIYSFQFDYQW